MNEEKSTKYPFSITEYYTPALNSLKRIYTQHPDFNGNVRLVYDLIFDYWNPDYGYAYPTIPKLAEDSGLGESTVKRCINTLVALELIEKRPSPVSTNNVYVPLKPVATIEEFIAKFPEVKPYMDERIAGIKAREAGDKKRLSGAKQAESVPVASSDIDYEWL